MVSVASVLQVLVVKMVLSRKAAEAAGIQLPEFPKQMGGLDSIARAGAPLQLLQDHPKKDSDFDSESDSDLDFQETGNHLIFTHHVLALMILGTHPLLSYDSHHTDNYHYLSPRHS